MRHTMAIARILSVAIAVSTASSRVNAQGPPTKVVGRPVLGPAGAPDRGPQTELSDEDCRAYAQSVVKAIRTGDRNALALVDWDSFAKAASAGLGISDEALQGYTRGMRSSLEGPGGFVDQLIRNSESGGYFHFLRVREDQERRVTLFRNDSAAGCGWALLF